jgi:hypothetical protein
LAYNANTFDHSQITQPLTLPLAPEPHVEAWEAYAAEAGDWCSCGFPSQRA